MPGTWGGCVLNFSQNSLDLHSWVHFGCHDIPKFDTLILEPEMKLLLILFWSVLVLAGRFTMRVDSRRVSGPFRFVGTASEPNSWWWEVRADAAQSGEIELCCLNQHSQLWVKKRRHWVHRNDKIGHVQMTKEKKECIWTCHKLSRWNHEFFSPRFFDRCLFKGSFAWFWREKTLSHHSWTEFGVETGATSWCKLDWGTISHFHLGCEDVLKARGSWYYFLCRKTLPSQALIYILPLPHRSSGCEGKMAVAPPPPPPHHHHHHHHHHHSPIRLFGWQMFVPWARQSTYPTVPHTGDLGVGHSKIACACSECRQESDTCRSTLALRHGSSVGRGEHAS